MAKEKTLKKGDKVLYIGRGFLSFDKSKPNAEFDCYEGSHDVYILYQGHRVLVYKHEIKPV